MAAALAELKEESKLDTEFEHYLCFDSWLKDPTSDPSVGEYRFNVSDFKLSSRADGLGITGPVVKNIREIQLQPFDIPIPAALPFITNIDKDNPDYPILVDDGSGISTDPVDGPLSGIPFSKRVGIEIVEAGTKNISVRSKNRTTFLTTARKIVPLVGTAKLRLDFDENMDIYYFSEPILNISTLSMRFSNPDVPLNLPPDMYYSVNLTKYTDGLVEYLAIDTKVEHDLALHDRIHVFGCSTGNQKIDNYVNRSGGLVVGANGSASVIRFCPDIVVTGIYAVPDWTPLSTKMVDLGIDNRRFILNARIYTE